MNISPISTGNNVPSFCSLKYQNGMKTNAGLSQDLNRLLTRNGAAIKDMKNIDIMVYDDGTIKLGIKTPRFLNKIYERFYKEERYDEVSNEGYSFIMTKGSCINKLVPDAIPGIYDIVYRNPDTDAWKPSYPVRTLEAAKSLDAIMQNIEESEDRFGLNCVEVLKNAEAAKKEEERLAIVYQIKSVYTTNNEFKNCDRSDLAILLVYKDDVEAIRNYKIIMDEVNFPYPVWIHDENGYLDDIYTDYYREHGWEFERYDKGFSMHPTGCDYPSYSLVDAGDKNYNAYVDFYEGGSNLGSFGEEHFRRLVELMQKLDLVAKSISEN